VLVADDEESICRTARLALEEQGYRVVTAADGTAAVDVFRRHPGQVRAVVLDVMMPGKDGADTFAELCRLDPAARVVLTSGRRPTGVLADAIAAGRVGFLPKPYSADRLAAAVAGVPADPRPDGD
jgi:CheY-like chemotaxis protein